jgi:hypothetical protein
MRVAAERGSIDRGRPVGAQLPDRPAVYIIAIVRNKIRPMYGL